MELSQATLKISLEEGTAVAELTDMRSADIVYGLTGVRPFRTASGIATNLAVNRITISAKKESNEDLDAAKAGDYIEVEFDNGAEVLTAEGTIAAKKFIKRVVSDVEETDTVVEIALGNDSQLAPHEDPAP